MNDGSSFGRLIRMHGITASSSADVTWRILVADTAEQVAANAKAAIEALVASSSPSNVHSSGTWTEGINHRSYPRQRSVHDLASSSAGQWAGKVHALHFGTKRQVEVRNACFHVTYDVMNWLVAQRVLRRRSLRMLRLKTIFTLWLDQKNLWR